MLNLYDEHRVVIDELTSTMVTPVDIRRFEHWMMRDGVVSARSPELERDFLVTQLPAHRRLLALGTEDEVQDFDIPLPDLELLLMEDVHARRRDLRTYQLVDIRWPDHRWLPNGTCSNVTVAVYGANGRTVSGMLDAFFSETYNTDIVEPVWRSSWYRRLVDLDLDDEQWAHCLNEYFHAWQDESLDTVIEHARTLGVPEPWYHMQPRDNDRERYLEVAHLAFVNGGDRT